MKNVCLTSRRTDLKVLAIAGGIVVALIAAAMLKFWALQIGIFYLLLLIFIFLVLCSGCGAVIYSPKVSLKFLRSRVGIISAFFALMFACLPIGCWWSAGIVRWQGGCPFYFIIAQGDTPAVDWELCPISSGLWYVWYWRLPADWLFWMILISFSAFGARIISRFVERQIRLGFIFASFICVWFIAYGCAFGSVWYYIFLSYLLPHQLFNPT
jgi:hypothetical protein